MLLRYYSLHFISDNILNLFSWEVWLLNDEKGGADLLHFSMWKQNG